MGQEGEFERITRTYATEFRPLIGEDRDTPAPDINTNQREMNWVRDTYETLENTTAPSVATGKSIESGGSEGRREATGRSVTIAPRELFEYLDWSLKKATVAIQGYGNLGSVAAELLEEFGATVVCVSDSQGQYSQEGLDRSIENLHGIGSSDVTRRGSGVSSSAFSCRISFRTTPEIII